MPKVLFIAYLYPPIANSGTRRSIEFVNRLPECGWQPTVLTLENPDTRPDRYDALLLGEVRPGTPVVRVPLASDDWARRLAGMIPARWRQKIQDSLEWRLREIWKVPDGAALWHGPAVRKAIALHAREGFDLVYASGYPWTSFLIANEVGRRTGLPFVLDYRDQWTPTRDTPWQRETFWQGLFRTRLEKKAAASAAAIVTTSPPLTKIVGKHTGREDLHCITNGFEPTNFAGLPSAPSDGLKRISYTGVWRLGYGLDLLYQALVRAKAEGLAGIDKVRVDAAGFQPGRAKSLGIDDLVMEHGTVSHGAALAFMGQSDCLFLPVPEGAYGRVCFPGKLFEYLGSGRPILAAAPSDSEVARVLNDVGWSQRLDLDDLEGMMAFLKVFCEGHWAASLPLRRDERIAQYTRASTTKQLANIFDAVIKTARGAAVQ